MFLLTIELTDFDEFVKNLKRLDETLKQTFFFQHIDEHLQIKFEPQITGNINVTGFLKDIQYVNTLNSSFEMPGRFNFAINSCVSQTSRALNMSGAFNIGIHPYFLHAQMYLRSIGVRPMLYSYYLNI